MDPTTATGTPPTTHGHGERAQPFGQLSGTQESGDLRSLPRSDWIRLWGNLRAQHLPKPIAREVQLSITSLGLDATIYLTALAIVSTIIISFGLIPSDTIRGRIWLGVQVVQYCVVVSGLWYLAQQRGRGTLTTAAFNRVLFVPTIVGALSWGFLPTVVGRDPLQLYFLAFLIGALACSVGYFWTLGHWPLSMLFALITIVSLTTTFIHSEIAGAGIIIALAPVLFLTLFGTSAMVQGVIVSSRYYEVTARGREQTIGLIVEDYERGGQDFLWETDERLQFTHVPAQMIRAGSGDPRIAVGNSLATLLIDQPDARSAALNNEPFSASIVTTGPTARGEIRLWGRPKVVRGKVFGYHGVGSDEGAARRAAESERTSERLDAMVTLTSGLAHDFNNQLATVLGAVELAALDPDIPETASSFLRRAVDACMRTRRITADLVVASGHDATYQAAPFAIGPTIDEVVSDLTPLFPDLELMVRHRAAPWVVADADHYRRAVRNLVQNACQAVESMPPDARHVRVLVHTVTSSTGERFACTDVVDRGPGVPPELADRIFEPFSTTRRDFGGTGLGLSVAHGFARQSGGSLTLQPTALGASFRLLLPLAESPQPVANRVATRVDNATLLASELSGTFLVVEDDMLVADNLATLLRSFGGEAEVADSVSGAIERFAGRTNEIECVISDLVLPDGEGFEVIAALRQHDPDLRAIYVSGFTPTLPADVAPELQCPFVAKPFSANELLRALELAGVGGPTRRANGPDPGPDPSIDRTLSSQIVEAQSAPTGCQPSS